VQNYERPANRNYNRTKLNPSSNSDPHTYTYRDEGVDEIDVAATSPLRNQEQWRNSGEQWVNSGDSLKRLVCPGLI
jgi:hypothetical protein